MTVQHSYSKIENELLPGFRKKIADAESTEDVKKFFVYTIQELFSQTFDGNVDLQYDDITLKPEKNPSYVLADWVHASSIFLEIWNTSDLSRVIAGFAETAAHRFTHLQKNSTKTQRKIRM